jgi:hypothetical protein
VLQVLTLALLGRLGRLLLHRRLLLVQLAELAADSTAHGLA